ncbi:hypothetical protein ACIBAC_00700 [Streptomyces sp. NPDC051362]|uniref:hypothetical protein n=1 Tax=Streptomyces sp. NPDC051362 TaxID=3365651 RepID=UPI0037A18788
MLRPTPPEELAALDALLRPGTTPSSFSLAVDAAEIHQATVAGRYTSEAFGRYCRSAVPVILARLLAAETELLTLRTKVAAHLAEADQGWDPAANDLFKALRRAGIDLAEEVAAAAAVLEADALAAATL